MSSIRENIIKLVHKMNQPSLPELMDLINTISYYYEEYRTLLNRSYNSLYYYMNSLVNSKSILSLDSYEGYKRRYCLYSSDRKYERFINPIPMIKNQTERNIELDIYNKGVIIDIAIREKDIYNMVVDGKKLNCLKIRNRIYVILDHVLIGVIYRNNNFWKIRMPWRIINIGTEYKLVFNTLKELGETIDVLGVKGKRTICGR